MSPRLALFDLDNTLLAGDSDHAWGEFLISQNLVDETTHRERNDEFYRSYLDGELDIHAYVQFTIAPILQYDSEKLRELHAIFMQEEVLPMLLTTAQQLVVDHRSAGDYCVIVTATNRFITEPIAELFQVDQLLATDLEKVDGHYTGKIEGIPCYQQGKVDKLREWLEDLDGLNLSNSIFYSDSINDLPLLESATEAVAVDPDEELAQVARDRNWRSLSLRG